MDPNETLAQLRKAHDDYLRETSCFDRAEEDSAEECEALNAMRDAADRISVAFGSLDAWLSTGGFLPDKWARYR